MNTNTPPAPSPLPGARPDDVSIAGEEDPGASLDQVISPGPDAAPKLAPEPVPEDRKSLTGG
jgi:hypothetical protein